MRSITIENDGTTTIEFTDAEAHQLRDELPNLPGPAAHTLQRLLAMAHGETSATKVAAGPCTVAWHIHTDGR